MDILQPFLNATSGNKWNAWATDYFTCSAEIKALHKGNAAEMARFVVENMLLQHGSQEVRITDKGTAFATELAQVILQYSWTSHRRTTAYNSQTNGPYKTLANMLAKYANIKQNTPPLHT